MKRSRRAPERLGEFAAEEQVSLFEAAMIVCTDWGPQEPRSGITHLRRTSRSGEEAGSVPS